MGERVRGEKGGEGEVERGEATRQGEREWERG